MAAVTSVGKATTLPLETKPPLGLELATASSYCDISRSSSFPLNASPSMEVSTELSFARIGSDVVGSATLRLGCAGRNGMAGFLLILGGIVGEVELCCIRLFGERAGLR